MTTAQAFPVPFYDDTLFVIEYEGRLLTPVKPYALALNFAWVPQYRKIVGDDLYNHMVIEVMSPAGPRPTLCLPLDALETWLASINPRKVRPEARDKLRAFRQESKQALHDYWQHGIAVRPGYQESVDATMERRLRHIDIDRLEKLRRLHWDYGTALMVEEGISLAYIQQRVPGATCGYQIDAPPIPLDALLARIPDCKSAEDERCWYFTSEDWTRFCKGFDPTRVAQEFRERRVLRAEYNRLTIRPPRALFGAERPRVYAILKAAFQPPTTH